MLNCLKLCSKTMANESDNRATEQKSSGRNESESQRMCGRFTLRTRAEEIALHFVLADVPDLKPRTTSLQPKKWLRFGSIHSGAKSSYLCFAGA